eukprot:4331185-Amphidinium_carterae.1
MSLSENGQQPHWHAVEFKIGKSTSHSWDLIRCGGFGREGVSMERLPNHTVYQCVLCRLCQCQRGVLLRASRAGTWRGKSKQR